MRLSLAQAAEVRLGRQRAPQYEAGESMVPYLRSANVTDGALDLRDVKQMNFTPQEQTIFGLESGDVLITEGSGSRETVGTSAVWLDEIESTVCFQNTLLRLRPREGVTDGRFLAWWARHARASGEIAAVSAGANIQHIGSDGLKRLRILVPSMGDQQRIADFLDDRVGRIDRIIAARRHQARSALENFETSRRSSALGLTETRTVPTRLGWAPFVGAGWSVRRLAHLAWMGTGHTPSRTNADYWQDCTIPWLTTSDVHRFRRDEIDRIDNTEFMISQLGLVNSSAVLHPAETVALSRTASAGFSIQLNRPMATSQDFVTWTCRAGLLPEFLLAMLRVMRPFLLGFLAIGSTHKTIYFPDLQDLSIPVPPIHQQCATVEAIASHAATYRSVRDKLIRQMDLLTEYKASLITAAVTGEIDVSASGNRIPA